MSVITCFTFDGNPHEIEESLIKPRTGSYGIYIQKGAVLLTNDENTDRWDLPGGGVEVGESIEEAVRREFWEETGLQIAGDLKFLKKWQEYYLADNGEAWNSDRNYYLVNEVEGQLQKEINRLGTAEARFVNVKELDKYNIKDNIKDLIQTTIELFGLN